jgi:hypothetical protein
MYIQSFAKRNTCIEFGGVDTNYADPVAVRMSMVEMTLAQARRRRTFN